MRAPARRLAGPTQAAGAGPPVLPRGGLPRRRRRAAPRWRCAAPAEACCASGAGPAPARVPLPRPNNPVTWPVFSDNRAIKSGLAPEQGATLRLYNWVAYINPDVPEGLRQEVQLQGRR